MLCRVRPAKHRTPGRVAASLRRPVKFIYPETVAEVSLADQRVADDVAWCTLGKFLAVVNDITSVGHAERLPHVMISQQDGDPTITFEVKDFPLQVLHGLGVNTAERLVEHDEFGFGHQRPGDLQLTSLAAGERARELLFLVNQAELFNELTRLVEALFARKSPHRLEDRQKVVLDRQPLEDARLLREISHPQLSALVHGQGGHIASVEGDRALIGVDHTDCHPEGGGLAGSVSTQKTDDLSRLDMEAQMVDDGPSIVTLDQAVDLQQRFVLLFHHHDIRRIQLG